MLTARPGGARCGEAGARERAPSKSSPRRYRRCRVFSGRSLNARFLKGMSFQQIASCTGRSTACVKKRHSIGLKPAIRKAKNYPAHPTVPAGSRARNAHALAGMIA